MTIVVGVSDRNTPLSAYIEGRAYVTPLQQKDSYASELYSIEHKFSCDISKSILKDGLYDKRFILDFQLAGSGIRKGKKSYVTFQTVLRRNSSTLKEGETFDVTTGYLGKLASTMSESLGNIFSEYGFTMTKTR